MAFYHTNRCDCPIGCCFCGPSSDNNLIVAYDLKKDKIFLYDRTNSSRYADVALKDMDCLFLGTLNGDHYETHEQYMKRVKNEQ